LITFIELPIIEPIFQYKTFRGTKLFWDFANDIPPIELIVGPDSPLWEKRVELEIETFEIWRKFNNKLPLRNLKTTTSKRRFTVEINIGELFDTDRDWETVHVLIPLRYPFQMPQIGDPTHDREFLRMFRVWTDGRPFCMPRVINLWWNKLKGRAGIAHYLHVFIAFVTIAGRKTKRIKTDFALDI